MGHVSMMRRALADFSTGPNPLRINDLGAGDGTFLLRLARALSRQWPAGRVVLVDRRPSVSGKTRSGFAQLGWEVDVIDAEVFEWLPEQKPVDVMVANLFLHHFEPDPLAQLLALAETRCRAFIACEPRRATPAFFTSRLLWLLGCHPVTRHDAVISVRAGFNGRELSAQWPGCRWNFREKRAGIFTHLFVARKQEGA
jgi:hypothetical protein